MCFQPRLAISVALVFLTASFSPVCRAEVFSYTFTGQINSVVGDFSAFPPFDQIIAGDPFTLTYDIDSAFDTDVLPADPTQGGYLAGANWKFVSGTVEKTRANFGLGIANGAGGNDAYGITVDFDLIKVIFALTDTSGTITDFTMIPEPMTATLVLLSLGGLTLGLRRRH